MNDPQGVAGVLAEVLSADGARDYVREYHERADLQDSAARLVEAAEADRAVTADLVAPFAAASTADNLLERARRIGLRTG